LETKRKSLVMTGSTVAPKLTELPDEMIYLIFSFLDPLSLSRLAATSRKFRAVALYPPFWRRFCASRKNLFLKPSGMTWRELFYQKSTNLCPHLSQITEELLMNKRDLRKNLLAGTASCTVCHLGMPNLWLCLTAGCGFVGCGRTSNRHALHHHENTAHPLTIKLKTLEIWCYSCAKWLGQNEDSNTKSDYGDPLELKLSMEIADRLGLDNAAQELNLRRLRERNMFLRLKSPLYIIDPAWKRRWNAFKIGDTDDPGPLNNMAVARLAFRKNHFKTLLSQQWEGAAWPNNEENQEEEGENGDGDEDEGDNDELDYVHFDIQVVNQDTWDYLVATYQAAPEISENDPNLTTAVRYMIPWIYNMIAH